ncbi:MAG TPA: biotin carboxylase N-terminal domain-containing protein, partial [Myxococcota bacterium]|nr:biotin carboxylase N-terminal domain-containing protein [Myxococcota bacterium]
MKVLVANRGEIACRILRTLKEMGVPSVAVYTDLDAEAPHVWMADEAVPLGGPDQYLSHTAILKAAREVGATALHPGYGFLSQNAAFARACAGAQVNFVGPSPEAMAALGDKRAAREVAEKHGIPVVPGAQTCDTVEAAGAAADRVGYPILLKAAGGGGGKGMRKVAAAAALPDAFAAARREAKNAFGDDRLLVEKYIFPARHVEVQVLGDGRRAVALGERECSLQRRYQKIIEEAPATSVSSAVRAQLAQAAVRLVEAVGYANAGTVEFLVGPNDAFYFLEVNTRLQVEHPVTEQLMGLDIVAAQIEVAHGGALPTPPAPRGHAIEARLNAEDPAHGFLPSVGKVVGLHWPVRPQLRVDAGIAEGSVVSPQYDSLLAKIIAWAPTREAARRRLVEGLRDLALLGLTTNQSFLLALLEAPFFKEGATFTTTVEASEWPAPEVPAYVQAAAALAPQGVGGGAAASGPSDPHSPWR